MDIDEDDDFYAPEEPAVEATTTPATTTDPTEDAAATIPSPQVDAKSDELEEGEEEDEGGAMDEDEDDSVGTLWRDSHGPFSLFIPTCTPQWLTVGAFCRTLISSPSAKTAQRRNPPRMFQTPSTILSLELLVADSQYRQSRYSDIRNIPQRSASNDMAVKPAPAKKEDDSRASPSDLPLGIPSADKAAAAASKSTIDVHANPDYPPAGKPITAVNIDEGKNPRPKREAPRR